MVGYVAVHLNAILVLSLATKGQGTVSGSIASVRVHHLHSAILLKRAGRPGGYESYSTRPHTTSNP